MSGRSVYSAKRALDPAARRRTRSKGRAPRLARRRPCRSCARPGPAVAASAPPPEPDQTRLAGFLISSRFPSYLPWAAPQRFNAGPPRANGRPARTMTPVVRAGGCGRLGCCRRRCPACRHVCCASRSLRPPLNINRPHQLGLGSRFPSHRPRDTVVGRRAMFRVRNIRQSLKLIRRGRSFRMRLRPSVACPTPRRLLLASAPASAAAASSSPSLWFRLP
jgi:hypothetical protein